MTLNIAPKTGSERDAQLLAMVQSGDYSVEFGDLPSRANGHSAVFRVFADALKIQGVRISVSASLAQRIADTLECLLLTARLADLLWAQRSLTLRPKLQVPDATMGDTRVFEDESEWIDGQLASVGWRGGGIVQTVGKHWIIDNELLKHPGMACNYGWHLAPDNMLVDTKGNVIKSPSLESTVSLPNVKLVQGRGFRHDAYHADYSQNCVLVSRHCQVDGSYMDLVDVLQSPDLAPLASAQGPLRVLRQPGVSSVPPVAPPPGGGGIVRASTGTGTAMKGIAIGIAGVAAIGVGVALYRASL
jgi:hypothetical protein